MNLYLFFITPILVVVFIGILVNPVVVLYYLVLDSWVVGKITDLGEILPFFSLNKMLVLISTASLLLHMALGTCKVDLRFLFSRTALILYAFIGYLFWSSLYLMGRNEPQLLNNLAFFVLILVIMGYKTPPRLNWVVAIIIAASAGIMLNTVGQRLIDARSLFADVSNGGRIQPGFHVLLTIPFLIAILKTNDNSRIRRWTKGLLIASILFVFAQLSRTLAASLLILACFYLMRGYIKVRWALLLVSVAAAVLMLDMTTDYGRTLLRLPSKTNAQVNAQEMQAFTSGRSVVYPIAWEMFLRNPVAGEGYDSFRRPKQSTLLVAVAEPRENSALHSTWLRVLSETGIIGTILYCGLYLSAYIDFKKTCRHKQEDNIRYQYSQAVLAGMLLFFLGGIFDNFGFDYRIFYLFVGLSIVLARGRGGSTNSDSVISGNLVSSPPPRGGLQRSEH